MEAIQNDYLPHIVLGGILVGSFVITYLAKRYDNRRKQHKDRQTGEGLDMFFESGKFEK